METWGLKFGSASWLAEAVNFERRAVAQPRLKTSLADKTSTAVCHPRACWAVHAFQIVTFCQVLPVGIGANMLVSARKGMRGIYGRSKYSRLLVDDLIPRLSDTPELRGSVLSSS